MRLPLRRTALLTSASALALGVSALAGLPSATADPAPPPPYAGGLTNPRGISVGPDGTLYVAEAGVGGDGPCVQDPEDPTAEVCLGHTGAVAAISDGSVRTVLSGLPSLGTDSPIGPQDVVVQPGGNFAVSMGVGQEQEVRDDVLHAPMMGTVYSGRLDRNGNVTRTRLTDIAAFEAAHNPDHSDMHDSDPGGLVASGGSYVLADAGGNTLLHATRGGQVRTLAVFPDRMVDVAPFLHEEPFNIPAEVTQLPMQAVPTAVAVGPDGAYYVSQLTGFPFPAGAADIWRVVPGQQPTVYASGLTNVTGLAWNGDDLYAVQMTDTGLLAGGNGSLVHVSPSGNTTVAGDLPLPYDVAIKDGNAYVTACTLCGVGGGFVAEIPLG